MRFEIVNGADVKKPERATVGSAGYDFFAPMDIEIKAGETVQFKSGIRCFMEQDVYLLLAPRSGLGFKYRLQLDNTIGVIDSDYYFSDNGGEIGVKLTNDGREGKTVIIPKGTAYMQGIFSHYLLTEDDYVTAKRNGGFGSTDKRGGSNET